jgi:hemolysin activation/secretion protein
MGVRGLGSEPVEFDNKRFGAKENFFHIRGDLSTTQDVKGGLQLYVRAQGQLADQPLVSSEQFSMGGVDTVRGYLETEALGDAAVAGTVELRTPNLGEWIAGTSKDTQSDPHKTVAVNDLRFFVFGDGGRAQFLKPLPEQSFVFDMASYGVGTRLKMFERLNGMVVFAVPVINQTFTFANKPRVLFRASGEF